MIRCVRGFTPFMLIEPPFLIGLRRLPKIPYRKISVIARNNSASDNPKDLNFGLSKKLIANSQNTA